MELEMSYNYAYMTQHCLMFGVDVQPTKLLRHRRSTSKAVSRLAHVMLPDCPAQSKLPGQRKITCR